MIDKKENIPPNANEVNALKAFDEVQFLKDKLSASVTTINLLNRVLKILVDELEKTKTKD